MKKMLAHIKQLTLKVYLSAALLLPFNPVVSQDIDTRFFDFWKYYGDGSDALYKGLAELGLDQLAVRENRIEALRTPADWQQRRRMVRETLSNIIGAFPDKTPLNARVTGRISRPDFTLEKIVYESMPGYHVTSVLLIPKGLEGRAPVVIYCSGHSAGGFRSAIYQHIMINLVKKGFVVFAFDPVGQGERYQYLDHEGQPQYGSTHEHSYGGTQCMIAGYSPAKFFVWDGIRAIDYLATRPEVDPDRIGITGRSGGGTQSAYIGAVDDRVTAAAPECYITSFEYLLKSRGPQDAEQNLFHGLRSGIDHPDFLIARAPKPTMVISTTRDFFSIQGARESYREAKMAFNVLGREEDLIMSEDDTVHASTEKNREAMYAFFQEYLDLPGDSQDREVDIFSDEELRVTPTGQVVTAYEGNTLFDLNRMYAETLADDLRNSRDEDEPGSEHLRQTVADLSAFQMPSEEPSTIFSGRLKGGGNIYEYYLMEGQGAYMVPFIYARPEKGDKQSLVMIINEQGKEAINNPEGMARQFLAQGYAVLVPDLPGFGELGPGYLKGDAYIHGVSHNQWYAGVLTGKSLCAIRAEEMIKLIRVARATLSIGLSDITLAGEGPLNSEILHTALFQKGLDNIIMVDPLVSYYNLVTTKDYESRWVLSAVPGMLTGYDLPDLLQELSDRNVLAVNLRNASGSVIEREDAANEWRFVLRPQNRGTVQLGYADYREFFDQLVLPWVEGHR